MVLRRIRFHPARSISLFAGAVLMAGVLRAASDPSGPGKEPELSDEAVVVEESSIRISFENDGTGIRQELSRVRIESDAGLKQFSVLTLGYQSLAEELLSTPWSFASRMGLWCRRRPRMSWTCRRQLPGRHRSTVTSGRSRSR